MNLKRIKQIIHESNFASSGMIRGLGMVTGEAGNAQNPGVNTSWAAQCSAEQSSVTSAAQSLMSDHSALHAEIESNDLNPKDKDKKVRVVNQT